jgi:predicted alpha/beta hydrolase
VEILLERHLALGQCVVRMISSEGWEVARILSSVGKVRGVFDSHVDGAAMRLVFATLARSDLPEAVRRVKAVDPEVFYVVERFSQINGQTPLPRPTGWRAVLKMK